MWVLRSAWLSETDEVNKLLEEDFEPFWGVRVMRNTKGTRMSTEQTKMYFRKRLDEILVTGELEEVEVPQFDVNVDLVGLDQILEKFSIRLEEVIKKLSADSNASQQMINTLNKDLFDRLQSLSVTPIVSLEGSHRDLEHALDDLKENDKEQTEVDEGGTIVEYKVVDDIPAEVSNGGVGQTEAQKEAITKIRKSSSTNITVNPVARNGVVVVLEGRNIHTIEPNGNVSTEETGAGTSSLSVG